MAGDVSDDPREVFVTNSSDESRAVRLANTFLCSIAAIFVFAACDTPAVPAKGVQSAAVSDQEAWRSYQGAWFSVDYPPDFQALPSLRAEGMELFDSVFFAAPDGGVSFYVLSPQWRREAEDIRLRPDHEEVVEEGAVAGGEYPGKFSLISARDKSYLRLIETYVSHDQSVSWTFQYRYADAHGRDLHEPDYRRCKSSLVQFTD